MRTCNNGWSIFFHLAPYPHKFLLQVVSMVGVAVHKQLHWLIKAQASQLLNLGAEGGGGGGGRDKQLPSTNCTSAHCYLSIACSCSTIFFVVLLHCVYGTLTSSVIVAEKSMVCRVIGHSLTIWFIWSMKCSSSILECRREGCKHMGLCCT